MPIFRTVALALTLVAGLVSVSSPVARAVYDGQDATGSPYVLTMLSAQDSRTSFCSMSLLSERVVVTAAHCVIANDSETQELRFPIEDMYVSLPGADVTTDEIDSRVKVLRVVTRDDYVNTWKPEIGDIRTQLHDIAFLFLAKPLVPGFTIPLATEAEIDGAIARNDSAVQFGYGLQSMDRQTHSPWTTNQRLLSSWPERLGPRTLFIMSQEGPSALCPGDSGGPWYLRVDGALKLAGVTVAAGGCRSAPPYNSTALATRIHPYLDLLESQWQRFLMDEPLLQEEERKRTISEASAKAEGTYTSAQGCHARGINAELQIKDPGGVWVKLTRAQGLTASSPSCPSTHQVTPWAVVSAVDGSTLRWRLWTSEWEVFSDPFVWSRQIPAVETPTATPTPTPTPTATKVPSRTKVTTIVCIKGSKLKKVKAIKPKCPVGYRKR